ncbi:hypothetical protein D9M69_652720 [compost metagenome]
MGLADVVDQPNLQRNDGHRGPGLRQQLQRTVEQCRVQDDFVQLGVEGGIPWHSLWHRRRGDGRGCHRGGFVGRVEHGGLFAFERQGLRCVQLEAGFQIGQESGLGRALAPVGITDTHGHFVGELALAGVRQAGHGVGQ